MTTEMVKKTTKEIVQLLAEKQYDAIVHITGGIRLDKEMIEQAILDYGNELAYPPESIDASIDIVPIKGAVPPRFSVRCPLWTKQEGQSDLSIELTIAQYDNRYVVELDDIRVL